MALLYQRNFTQIVKRLQLESYIIGWALHLPLKISLPSLSKLLLKDFIVYLKELQGRTHTPSICTSSKYPMSVEGFRHLDHLPPLCFYQEWCWEQTLILNTDIANGSFTCSATILTPCLLLFNFHLFFRFFFFLKDPGKRERDGDREWSLILWFLSQMPATARKSKAGIPKST